MPLRPSLISLRGTQLPLKPFPLPVRLSQLLLRPSQLSLRLSKFPAMLLQLFLYLGPLTSFRASLINLFKHSLPPEVVTVIFLYKADAHWTKKTVTKRHQMLSGSLALLYCFSYFFSLFNGSRAAAPVGDKVL